MLPEGSCVARSGAIVLKLAPDWNIAVLIFSRLITTHETSGMKFLGHEIWAS